MTYEVVTTIMAALLLIWLFWRLLHPMTCHCGFSTRMVWRLKKHVLQRHGWDK